MTLIERLREAADICEATGQTPNAALLREAADAMDWQPIETAPKDGGPFLARCDGQVWVGHWESYAIGNGGWWRDATSPSHLAAPILPDAWRPLS